MNTKRQSTIYKQTESNNLDSDWQDLLPKSYTESMRAKGYVSRKYGYCNLENTISDPNLKYTEYNYQVMPDDVLICMGEAIPMFKLGLFAIRDLRWLYQSTLILVYKHFETGEIFELEATYETHVDDDDSDCYGNVEEVIVKRLTYEEFKSAGTCFILDDYYKTAFRKFKISNLL